MDKSGLQFVGRPTSSIQRILQKGVLTFILYEHIADQAGYFLCFNYFAQWFIKTGILIH